MSVRASFLVEKRDGRVERLRATKLGRSIHLALLADADAGEADCTDLTVAVLDGLRPVCQQRGAVSAARVAREVERVLRGAGRPAAAVGYCRVGVERARRRSLWTGLCAATVDGVPEEAPAWPLPPAGLSSAEGVSAEGASAEGASSEGGRPREHGRGASRRSGTRDRRP